MNRQPYKAEKRRKEIARQKKQEEKRLKRLEKKRAKEEPGVEGEVPEGMVSAESPLEEQATDGPVSPDPAEGGVSSGEEGA